MCALSAGEGMIEQSCLEIVIGRRMRLCFGRKKSRSSSSWQYQMLASLFNGTDIMPEASTFSYWSRGISFCPPSPSRNASGYRTTSFIVFQHFYIRSNPYFWPQRTLSIANLEKRRRHLTRGRAGSTSTAPSARISDMRYVRDLAVKSASFSC